MSRHSRRRSAARDRVRILADRDTLPCEIDRAKPDRLSRLARSSCLSKILRGFPPGRGPLDRGSNSTSECPRTCALARFFAHLLRFGRFCANLPRVSNLSSSVKLNAALPAFAQRNLSNNYQPKSTRLVRADLGSREIRSRVLQWLLFSVGFPTGARSKTLTQTQRTCFPLPSMGRPNGHRDAPLLSSIFPRVAQATPRRNWRPS